MSHSTMTTCRQLEVRHLSAEVTLVAWNPTMDLLCMATACGEVLLHRLSWQRVWSVPPAGSIEQPVLVVGLAWRPDGRILAYAYDTGKVTLCDVENAEIVHVLNTSAPITFLGWTECSDCPTTERGRVYTDRSDDFLPHHYTSNKAYASGSKQTDEVSDDFKKMKGQKELNMLIMGLETGAVHLFAFGMFPVGFVDTLSEGEEPVKVLLVNLSADFRVLSVVVERRNKDTRVLSYHYRSMHMSLLERRMEEVKVVAVKYGQLASLLTYLSSTIRAISEAWEDILMEVDTKLHNYVAQKQAEDSSISDDFIELLMFGYPSDSLEQFLMHELTETGLKKFGHSIEMSYSNIQKLVLKRLRSVASSLYYHLGVLRGMASLDERFGELGLDQKAITAALLTTGSFLLKAAEIQQVIDTSMKNFKSFFRWLYGVILRLSEEPVPSEVSRLSEQDLNFVAEFLQDNFVTKCDAEGHKTMVKLERVAQYLKHEDLSYPGSTAGNPWVEFLEKHPEFYETEMVFRPCPNKSLVTMFADLQTDVGLATKGTWNVMHKAVKQRLSHALHTGDSQGVPVFSSISSSQLHSVYSVVTEFPPPCVRFLLFREDSKEETPALTGVAVTFQSTEAPEKNHKVLDVKFYNSETLSVLLIEDAEGSCPVLFQLPLEPLLLQMGPPSHLQTVLGSKFMETGNTARMEGARAAVRLATCGTRKLVAVLSPTVRQVRLFEMDVDDDDEEANTNMDDSEVADDSAVGEKGKG